MTYSSSKTSNFLQHPRINYPVLENYEDNNKCKSEGSLHCLLGSDGFWGSSERIGIRLGMLSGSINVGGYNNAFQVLALAYGVDYFKMAGATTKILILHQVLWDASIDKAC
jgi:hypothetical protein